MVGVTQKLTVCFPSYSAHRWALFHCLAFWSEVMYGIEMIHWEGLWHCPYQTVSQLTIDSYVMTVDSYVKFEVLMAVILLGSDAMCTMWGDSSHVIHAIINVGKMKRSSH